jgi:hypothetical protein
VSLPVAIVVRAMLGASDTLVGDERRLSDKIDTILPDDTCTPPDVALRLVEKLLASEPHSSLSLRVLPGAELSRCVSVAVDFRNGWVLLVPGSDPELSAELAQLRRDALQECLTRDQLLGRVTAIAARHQLTEFRVRDGGPITVPIDGGALSRVDLQAALAHYAQGCFLYSGLTWAPDGRPVFVFAGRRAVDPMPPLHDHGVTHGR